MRVVVTGGAGFLGSHLCEALVARGDAVYCVDNFLTSDPSNIDWLLSNPNFHFIQADVSEQISVPVRVDAIAHLASAASPPDYHRFPLETLAAGSRGTQNCLDLALLHGARFVLASTSEIYGDPLVHPQTEDYWGNVSTIGPRSVYDESKRFAEALTAAYCRSRSVRGGILRIFNTFGPRMRPSDGRVVSNFITQALNGDPITIYGDGLQTRSFCYVDDLVRGIVAMLDSEEFGPVNMGNPLERTIRDLAEAVISLTGSRSPVQYHDLPVDDPTRRRPDISRAGSLLGWHPAVDVEEGLRRTVAWFGRHRQDVAAAAESVAGPQFQGDSVPA